MTYQWFVAIQAIFAIGVFFLPLSALKTRRRGLLRLMVIAATTAFFFDYPGECRGLWRFSTRNAMLLDIPVINLVMIGCAMPYAIVLWETAKALDTRRNSLRDGKGDGAWHG